VNYILQTVHSFYIKLQFIYKKVFAETMFAKNYIFVLFVVHAKLLYTYQQTHPVVNGINKVVYRKGLIKSMNVNKVSDNPVAKPNQFMGRCTSTLL